MAFYHINFYIHQRW